MNKNKKNVENIYFYIFHFKTLIKLLNLNFSNDFLDWIKFKTS